MSCLGFFLTSSNTLLTSEGFNTNSVLVFSQGSASGLKSCHPKAKAESYLSCKGLGDDLAFINISVDKHWPLFWEGCSCFFQEDFLFWLAWSGFSFAFCLAFSKGVVVLDLEKVAFCFGDCLNYEKVPLVSLSFIGLLKISYGRFISLPMGAVCWRLSNT